LDSALKAHKKRSLWLSVNTGKAVERKALAEGVVKAVATTMAERGSWSWSSEGTPFVVCLSSWG